jgi:hypothetical protein
MSSWGHLRAGIRFGNGRRRVECGVKETGKDEVLWNGDGITNSLWLLLLLLVLVLVLGGGDWSSGSNSGGRSMGTRSGVERGRGRGRGRARGGGGHDKMYRPRWRPRRAGPLTE